MLGGNAYALIFLGAVWLVLFGFFRDLRREQMLASIMASALFPILQAYAYQDILYVERLDYLAFLFLVGGLSSILYHVIFGQYYLHTPRHFFERRTQSSQLWVWKWVALVFTGAWLLILFSALWPTLPLGWNIFLMGILFALYYAIARRELLFDACMSALLMIALFAMVDITLAMTTEMSLDMGIYLQAAGLGLFFGPLYEFARNLHLSHV